MIIKDLVQTPFISHNNENMIIVRVADWDFCNPYIVEIMLEGKRVYIKDVFASEFSANLPCPERPTECTVRITPFEDLPVSKTYMLAVPKRWQIPLLYSSHEDLGYCAYIDKLHHECYEYLKEAMKLCRKHKDFKYMIEHYWWIDAFDTYASDKEKEELKELIRQKKIDLNAIHSGVHTSWANTEQLIRSMYFPCRDAKEKYGVEANYSFYVDLSGASSGVINAHSKMGIKYMGAFSNGFRNCPENKTFPPLFRWKDQSGESEVIFWYQRSYREDTLRNIWCDTLRQYPEGEYFFDTSKALKTEKWLTEKIISLGECEYDILPISFYDDREKPTTMLLTVCREMNKRWKYPQFRMEIPSVFMREIDEKYRETLPAFCGDISDQWADFATIAPALMSKRREVSRMLYKAEFLNTKDAICCGKGYNKSVFTEAVWNMGLFDEHCWATSSKHPQKMHRSNIDKVKREPVEKTYNELKAMLCSDDNDLTSIANLIPRGYNSALRLDKGIVPKELKHQILPDGLVITSPIHFSAAEIRAFECIKANRASKELNIYEFETDYYKVIINAESKRIESIFDKDIKEELTDRYGDFDFGQFVYLYTEDKLKPRHGYEVAKKTEIKVYEGDVAFVVCEKSFEEQSGAVIYSRFIFYKEEKNIDIDLSCENVSGLIGDFYDRYKKNYFFAFPFSLANPTFYSELSIGEKNENTDTLPLNASDFSVIQNYTCAENGQNGIAIYSGDMPVFHLGSIKYNNFDSKFHGDKAHFFLYAISNRCNNLIYRDIADCRASYHLSLLPYSGKHNFTVPIWSTQKACMPVILKNPEEYKELICINADNIRLVSFKKSENCSNAVVLRFAETSGVRADAKVSLFFKPLKAMYADNCENDITPVSTDGKTIGFAIEPYSCVTLKVYGDFNINEV